MESDSGVGNKDFLLKIFSRKYCMKSGIVVTGTLCCQIETPGFLFGRVFSRPPCGNTDDFKYMYLCHKDSGQ